MKMTPAMPELLVALDILQLLVFELAADAMAAEIPLGAGVIHKQRLSGEFGEVEGLTGNRSAPGMEVCGVCTHQKQHGDGANGVFDKLLVDE
jgi:hypothetical protein